jgi:putative membrane protein insertion efficiency factor
MKRLVLLALHLYRRAVSPALGPCCRFEPTCSVYAEEAVHTHGVLRGLRLAVWRVLRCHPFARAGFDPVPLPERSPPASPRALATGSRV